MMKSVLASLFVAILASCSPSPQYPPVSSLEERTRALVALVSEVDHSPFCSGSFIDHRVVTAAHCVDTHHANHTPLTVGLYADYDSESMEFSAVYEFDVSAVNYESDVAILTPRGYVSRHEVILVSRVEPSRGEYVQLLGHPIGYMFYFSEGRVMNTHVEDGMKFTIVNATAYPGMSGGPALNERGELVGIVSFGWTRVTNNVVGIVHLSSITDIL